MAKQTAFKDQFGTTQLPRLSDKKVRPKPKKEPKKKKTLY